MPELRIILLVVGVLFVAGIAGYEWWRSRGARPLAASLRADDAGGRAAASAPAPLPDINVVRDSRVAKSDSLPVIELASTSESGTRRALGISISDDVAVDVAHDSGVARGRAARAHNEPYIGEHDEISEVRIVDEQPRASGRSSCSPGPTRTSAASSRCASSRASSRVSRAAHCARLSAPPASGTARSTSITCPTKTAASC